MNDGSDVDTMMDMLIVSRVLESGSKEVVRPMFCQMNRLTDSGNDIVWMQVARWIKFEEVLEEDANRWSKPHVPSLSLKALTCLRKELRHSSLLLDPEVTDFSSIVDKITAAWIHCGYLDRQLEFAIKKVLHKPVRHVHKQKLPSPLSVGSNLLATKERGLGGSNVSLHSVESYASDKDGSAPNSNEDVSEAGSHKGTPKVYRAYSYSQLRK